MCLFFGVTDDTLTLIVIFNFNINTTFIVMIICNVGSDAEHNMKCTNGDKSSYFLLFILYKRPDVRLDNQSETYSQCFLLSM
jgi:hypothetical protein